MEFLEKYSVQSGVNEAPDALAGGVAALFATVKLLPLLRSRSTALMPVLFVRKSTGSVGCCREALEFAYASSRVHSPGKVHADIKTLAKLFMFVDAVTAGDEADEKDLEHIVYQYLSCRLVGSLDESQRCKLGGLNWSAVRYATVLQEFRAIVRFFDFCAYHYGFVELVQHYQITSGSNSFRQLHATLAAKKADFFSHLHASRLYWQNKRGSTKKQMPRLVSIPSQRQKEFRQFPDIEEVVGIVNATSNVVYKSIFILAAFGGLRVSEIVNLWSIDVLPGSLRPYFFEEITDFIDAECLVLRCDPVHSTYCGEISDSSRTRLQFLRSEFGLLPRPMLDSTDRLYAGWKGTRFSGAGHLHPVFWIEKSAARLFESTCERIKSQISYMGSNRSHPFLYVNLSDRSQRYLGHPTTIKQVQKALVRSCRRCGIDPRRRGANIHGLRHFYKWFAREQLNVPEEHIQVMMGHSSIHSQDDYGRNASSLYELLSSRSDKIGDGVLE